MSRVTTVLLSVGSEEDEGLVPELNDRLRDEAGWPDWTLRNLDDAEFGGNKVPEPLFGGALKYFDLARFAHVLRTMPWRKPDAVQVMIFDEDNFRWRLFSLADLPQSSSSPAGGGSPSGVPR